MSPYQKEPECPSVKMVTFYLCAIHGLCTLFNIVLEVTPLSSLVRMCGRLVAVMFSVVLQQATSNLIVVPQVKRLIALILLNEQNVFKSNPRTRVLN